MAHIVEPPEDEQRARHGQQIGDNDQDSAFDGNPEFMGEHRDRDVDYCKVDIHQQQSECDRRNDNHMPLHATDPPRLSFFSASMMTRRLSGVNGSKPSPQVLTRVKPASESMTSSCFGV